MTDPRDHADAPLRTRPVLEVGGVAVGDGHGAFIVAELSANHHQDLSVALDTITAAAEAGADAVKLQTYTPDTITFRGESDVFRVNSGSVWDGRTLYDLYAEAYTPWEWHAQLFEHARSLGLVCFSSPFDPTALDLLESLDAPAYKVASFEITDIPLIEQMAATGKPVVISTGVAQGDDIDRALAACAAVGNDQVLLLKCTSSYPAEIGEANLRTMVDMRRRFGTLVGLSDHTTGHAVAAAATALGACFIEKHLIIDRAIGGPDSGFSLEPAEFAALVQAVRDTEASLGAVTYELSPGSRGSRQFVRSLFVVADVRAGDVVSTENVRSIRPANGLAPQFLPELLGRSFACDIRAGTPLTWDQFRD